MEKRQKILALFIGFIILLALPRETFAQLRTVKVALTSKVVLDNLPYFVGMKMGFFKEVGVDLQPSYFRGGGEVVRGITTRATDIGGAVAPSAIFIAVSKGEPIKILSGNVAPLTGLVWIVKADSPIKSFKDLKGKKLGFSSPGSVTHTTIQAILKAERLDKDVELVRAGSPGDNWTAIKNGIIDAGWNVSPAIYTLLAKKEARIIINGSDYIKDYQQSAVAAMEDVIKKDPDMIRNFLKARAKAVKLIGDNPEKTISIWAEELKLPVDAVRLAYKDLPKGIFEISAPKRKNLEGSLQEAIGTGAMKGTLDLKKVLDLRFLP